MSEYLTPIGHEAPIPVVYSGQTQSAKTSKEAEAAKAKFEALKILDKEDLRLGDLNPLIHATDLTRKESVDAVRLTTLQKIYENGGLLPTVLESMFVSDPRDEKKCGYRFIASFEVPTLSEHQLGLLEELVGQTYGTAVRTRTDSKGNDMALESYPPTQMGEELKSKTGGWYMGPDMTPTTSIHQGLFVFRDLGQINKDNFLNERETDGKYVVEIREAGQFQTDLVTFVTQVASVLGQERLLDKGQLLYESYNDLQRLGIKKVKPEEIYGMDDITATIWRELLTPLASPGISSGVNTEPQSVLLIGAPGTGKTLAVEGLLQTETGVFIVPLDPFELHKELSLPKEKQTLLARIAEVCRITGKQVVLHVDDIENMVQGDENIHSTAPTDIHSTMLNLMAGVKECGFYLIASTNYPNKIHPSLIQPQRFSVPLYCGLQDEKARYEILKIHANKQSQKLGIPLFTSEEVRDIVLQEIASLTEFFPPRYLANIATVAKSFLVERIAKDKGKTIGLTEEDLAGYTFSVDDWEKAFAEVAAKSKTDKVKAHDEELRKFVASHTKRTPGFAESGTGPKRSFRRDVFERILAAEVELRQEDS